LFRREALRSHWRTVKPYFIFAVILFFASAVVGAASHDPIDWLDQAILSIRDISESAATSATPERTLFTAILFNNIYSSLMALYLGILAGVMPIVTLIVNGMLMGYLLGNLADAGSNVWVLIVKGILPHGILEIPALLLACGYGVRLGFSLVRGIFAALIGKTQPWSGFAAALKGSVPAAVLIVLLLLAAAVVESTVTYWLMKP
jgi:stage II sporulation protein M